MGSIHTFFDAPWIEQVFGFPYRIGISLVLLFGTAFFYYLVIWFQKWQEGSFYPEGHPLRKDSSSSDQERGIRS